MRYRDIEVVVQVGDQALAEYAVDINEEKRQATCWVASEEGKEFRILVDNKLSTHGISSQIRVDGRLIDRVWTNTLKRQSIQGAYPQADVVLPFLFSRIELTEEISNNQRTPDLDALGCIQLVMRRGTRVGATSWSLNSTYDHGNLGPLHERTKKAGAHCISLGAKRTIPKPSHKVRIDHTDTFEDPYCIFLFRYRPRDMLQAQGIIPAQPQLRKSPSVSQAEGGSSHKRPRETPKDKETGVKEESDDEEEDPDEIQARLDAMVANIDALRAQMSKAKDKRERKRVKREPSPIHMTTSGDVIDLTSD